MSATTNPPPATAAAVGPLLLDAKAAADYCGLSRTRLFDLQRTGELPGVLVGGRRYWRRGDLDDFVAGL
jgi:hypothetical protein